MVNRNRQGNRIVGATGEPKEVTKGLTFCGRFASSSDFFTIYDLKILRFICSIVYFCQIPWDEFFFLIFRKPEPPFFPFFFFSSQKISKVLIPAALFGLIIWFAASHDITRYNGVQRRLAFWRIILMFYFIVLWQCSNIFLSDMYKKNSIFYKLTKGNVEFL